MVNFIQSEDVCLIWQNGRQLSDELQQTHSLSATGEEYFVFGAHIMYFYVARMILCFFFGGGGGGGGNIQCLYRMIRGNILV